MLVLFWVFFGLIAYHYLFYPVLIKLLSLKKRIVVDIPDVMDLSDDQIPTVSFIVAAYNEEKVIEEKIRNTLSLDYPKNKIEIIIASHGSDDNTASIAKSYANDGVISLHSDKREGKTAALNYAVDVAKGDIIVFSDANNMFSVDAVKYLVRHYVDPSIGGVCGLKSIISATDRQSSEGDGLYWKYESAIKNAESKCGTITNADGEIFSLRRDLYEPMDKAIINDDLELTFDLINKGYRIVYEMKATSSELASINLIDDYFVKVRMVAGGFQALSKYFMQVMFPRSLFSWMFFSHKVLRWLMPVFLLIFFIMTILNIDYSVPLTFFYLQLVFYGLAITGYLFMKQLYSVSLFYIPLYFVMMNVAAAHGLIRHISKAQSVSWRKADRV